MAAGTPELAPAKINLDLRIIGRRADGYHELDSIVVFADLADRLDAWPDDQLTLQVTGPFAPALAAEPDNLVLRAARRLAQAAGIDAGARIDLEKNLPVAAGIGGGSADAAAALRALDRLWGLGWPAPKLAALAAELGADVPVCLVGRPARIQGVGERVTPLTQVPSLPLLLANPGTTLATSHVFAAIERFEGAEARTTVPTDPDGLVRWLAGSANHLEAPATRLCPVIGAVLERLRAMPGCRLARMSGSGATCFGLFDDHDAAEAAEYALRRAHPDWWLAATRTLGS